jgi:t-SNARE complex subunit (syntaxin)
MLPLSQVNEIFKDLAGIVQEQKKDIDTIETQIESSHVSAKEGLNQVTKASELQPKCAIM